MHLSHEVKNPNWVIDSLFLACNNCSYLMSKYVYIQLTKFSQSQFPLIRKIIKAGYI